MAKMQIPCVQVYGIPRFHRGLPLSRVWGCDFSRPLKPDFVNPCRLPGTIVPGYFQSPYRAEDWNTRIKFLVVVYALDELKYFIVSK